MFRWPGLKKVNTRRRQGQQKTEQKKAFRALKNPNKLTPKETSKIVRVHATFALGLYWNDNTTDSGDKREVGLMEDLNLPPPPPPPPPLPPRCVVFVVTEGIRSESHRRHA